MMRWVLGIAGGLFLAGCGTDGDTPAYPSDRCTTSEAFARRIALDDASALGYSGAGVIAAINAHGPVEVTWQTGATTMMTLTATATETTAVINAPPPYQGYCQPRLSVAARLDVSTDDGRLVGAIPATLGGVGPDQVLDMVFPFDARFTLVWPTTLPIPASWSSPSRPYEAVVLTFHVEQPGTASPYCLPGELVSDDPRDPCNRYSGVIRYVSYDPNAPVEGPLNRVESPVGWWTW